MCARSGVKVLKSRTAAAYLHSEAALAEGDITRAAAAEYAKLWQITVVTRNLGNAHQDWTVLDMGASDGISLAWGPVIELTVFWELVMALAWLEVPWWN